MLRENLERVQERIAEASLRSGRKAEDITLVAVTKGVPKAAVSEALSLGVGHIGESRVQETGNRWGDTAMTDRPIQLAGLDWSAGKSAFALSH